MVKTTIALLTLLLLILSGPQVVAAEPNTWVSEDLGVSVTWSDNWSDAAGPSFSSPDRAFVNLGSDDLAVSITVFPTNGASLFDRVQTYINPDGANLQERHLYHRPWDSAYGVLTINGDSINGYIGFKFTELRVDFEAKVFYLTTVTLNSPDLPALEMESDILEEIKIVGPDGGILHLELPSAMIPTIGFPELMTSTPTPTKTPIPTSTPLPSPTPTVEPRPTQTPVPTSPPVDCSGYSDWRQKTTDRVARLDGVLNDLQSGLSMPGLWRTGAKNMALSALQSLWSEILDDEPAAVAANAEPYFQQGISEFEAAVQLLTYQSDDLIPVYTPEINQHLDAANSSMVLFLTEVQRLDLVCGYSG